MFARFRKTSPAPDSAAAMRQSAQWLEATLGVEGGYRFAEGCPRTLLATCFGVCALELLGAVDELPAPRRRALVEGIARCQQAESGLFRDPLHGEALLLRLPKFTPLYVEWQETYFALHALDALGEAPAHPLRFVEPFREPAVLDVWLRTLAFDDFWFVSNYLMFLLLFLVWQEGADAPTAHRLLDWLDARQDPRTGFWGTEQGASLFNGMAGAFHVFGFYRYLGRQNAHEGAAVRSTLELQESTGLFGQPGGGPCEDVDALDILAKLAPAGDEDERAVRRGLERALPALRSCRVDGGGYRWLCPLGKTRPTRITYSGLETLAAQSDQGDVWSTWFRPLAIALARERLGLPPAWPVRFRRLPLLGWHPAGGQDTLETARRGDGGVR